MPFLELKDRKLRMYVRINSCDESQDALAAAALLDPTKAHVVLIHAGASDGGRDFGGQLNDPRLLGAFNLVAVDLRFSGRTEELKRREDLSLSDLSKDVSSALSSLKLSKYSLVGQGVVGCHTAIWTALNDHKKVQSLVLCSPCPLTHDPRNARSMLNDWFPAWKEGDPGCADFAESYYFSNFGERFPGKRDQFMRAFVDRYGSEEGMKDIRQILNYFAHTPIDPKLIKKKITCPVLILAGGGDAHASPRSAAEDWCALFPRGELHVLNDAPHLVTYFEPNLASRFFLRFVGRALSGAK